MPTFSEPVDFAKKEARNLVTHKLATAPPSPVAGQRYFDTTLNKEAVYSGSSWDYVGSGLIVYAQQNTPTPLGFATDTLVPFSAEIIDNQNIFSNGYFIPIVSALYRISCNLYFSVDNGGWVGDHRAALFQGATVVATLLQDDVYVTNFITSGRVDIPLTMGLPYHIRASSSPYSNGTNPKIATRAGALNTLTIEKLS